MLLFKLYYIILLYMNRTTDNRLGSSKPLIPREQNYILDRKLVTVHSEDRDITKWPSPSSFEIILPETLLNVQSIRLIQATMPGKFFTFSDDYQNTKLQLTMSNDPSNVREIKIQKGYYSPAELTIELTARINRAIGTDVSFNVFYDNVAQKFWFGHTDLSFNLLCCNEISYDFSNCEQQQQPLVWNNHSNWGLPYYLGFQKKCYTSNVDLSGIEFDYVYPSNNNIPNNLKIKYYVEAPFSFNIGGDTCMYMEIDKYNTYDELYPYNQSSRQMYDNNAYNGKTNSAFAKIPIKSHTENSYDSRTFYLHNLAHYDPPIERMTRLKFKFRFHDGRLVNFQNYPFDFTLEFNSLRNEMGKQYNVRIPATYIL
jgi:hypothetical protein